MATSRPRRNSQKLPDPDFVTDFMCYGPRKSESPKKTDKPVGRPKKRSSVVGKLTSEVKPPPSPKKRKTQLEPEKPWKQSASPKVAKVNIKEESGLVELDSQFVLSQEIEGKQNSKLKRKPCDRTGCPCNIPICFAGLSDRCAGARYTSRWYHVSSGEHYCNECFEYCYRSRKPGNKIYMNWKQVWSSNSQVEVGIKMYMADRVLPYWLQCVSCGKWRQISKMANPTPEFISHYKCGMNSSGIQKFGGSACLAAEDKRVQQAQQEIWMAHLNALPFLQSSPAAPYLTKYYPDGVGMSSFMHSREKVQNVKSKKKDSSESASSSDSSSEEENENQTKKDLQDEKPETVHTSIINEYFQPFQQPDESPIAFAFPPNYMTLEEREVFPDYISAPSMYLGVRNLILTLWTKNCKEWLRSDQCMYHVICRGLARVHLRLEVDRIVDFLTRKGYINTGMVQPPEGLSLHLPCSSKGDVVIIGAGPAGIGTALRLQRHGIKATVLEARSRVGGRVWDNSSLGVCVGKGAMIVTGCINNPITTLCQQLDINMSPIVDRCDLIDEMGKITQSNIDKRIDFHFNAMLDNVAEWRKNKTSDQDVSLLEKIQDMHTQFLEESQLSFPQEEDRLLKFHISNLEYACGSELSHVSALHWDQNEQFDQWSGCHALLPQGYSQLFSKVAERLDVRLNTKVTSIDYSGEKVKINTSSGEFLASHVVVTVPLAVLQEGLLEFLPALPASKVKAIKSLGAGIIEKVALRFPQRFWETKSGDADFFGHVSASDEERGLFGVFYDLTPRPRENPLEKKYVLMTYVSGPALKLIKNKTDQEIVNMAVEVLRKMFPEVDVPDPLGSFVTRWQDDPFASMAYSYIPVGSSGAMYDTLAKSVGSKLFFAGEATNREFPQTVTGAYLSGIREAKKIMEHLGKAWEKDHPSKKQKICHVFGGQQPRKIKSKVSCIDDSNDPKSCTSHKSDEKLQSENKLHSTKQNNNTDSSTGTSAHHTAQENGSTISKLNGSVERLVGSQKDKSKGCLKTLSKSHCEGFCEKNVESDLPLNSNHFKKQDSCIEATSCSDSEFLQICKDVPPAVNKDMDIESSAKSCTKDKVAPAVNISELDKTNSVQSLPDVPHV